MKQHHPHGVYGVLGLFALCVFGACAGADAEDETEESNANLAAAACTPYLGDQCYWMENTSGNFCWVPRPGVSFQNCYALDSCDGGLGHSGGGCYKWAACSGCTRLPW